MGWNRKFLNVDGELFACEFANGRGKIGDEMKRSNFTLHVYN